MPSHCKSCGQAGHNVRTCPSKCSDPDLPAPAISTGRACSACGQPGHNARTCKTKGRSLLEQSQARQPKLKDAAGTLPAKGLWIINPDRQQVAGKIIQVKRQGIVLWLNPLGAHVASTQETILNSGYVYAELEPRHLLWEATGMG